MTPLVLSTCANGLNCRHERFLRQSRSPASLRRLRCRPRNLRFLLQFGCSSRYAVSLVAIPRLVDCIDLLKLRTFHRSSLRASTLRFLRNEFPGGRLGALTTSLFQKSCQRGLPCRVWMPIPPLLDMDTVVAVAIRDQHAMGRSLTQFPYILTCLRPEHSQCSL